MMLDLTHIKKELGSCVCMLDKDHIRDMVCEIEHLRSQLAKYTTPMVDDVEFLPSDPSNHEVK
jgi:hypothetical protein